MTPSQQTCLTCGATDSDTNSDHCPRCGCREFLVVSIRMRAGTIVVEPKIREVEGTDVSGDDSAE